MKFIYWFIRIILFLIVLTFSVRNTEAVVIRWLPGLEVQMPLVVALLLAFILGVLCALFIVSPSWMRAKRSSGQAQKALVRLEKTHAEYIEQYPASRQNATLSTQPPVLSVGPTHGI
ncbi:MAG: LapA family protein [Limnobacter sp.]|nr:LapA family protein [Limnobacter sp.]